MTRRAITRKRLTPAIWLFALSITLRAQVSVLTYQYDLGRTGANPNEVILTPANVNASQFGKLATYSVDGVLYGQPLYLPNIGIPGKGIHNVIYAATEHDSVYAFDADSNLGPNAAPLWQVSFLNPSSGVTTVPSSDTGCSQITSEIGITSTPVIDPASGTIYVVAMTKETAAGGASYVHRLHALDIASGAEKPGSPVTIQASSPGAGDGASTDILNPKSYKQRPGLLLWNGVIYAGFSSHCDIGQYHGWLLGYDAQTLRQVSVYNTTPDGNQGSLWAGGAAPAVDSAGNIYVVSGNGSFNRAANGPNLGESYIKLSSAASLSVTDYFTPFNYAPLDSSDADTGSSGVALLPDEAGSAAHPHLMVGAGKEGRIYLLDRDSLGGWQAGSDSQIVQSIPGVIGELFGNPGYFNNTVYFCGASDNLKAFPIANAQMATAPASQSATKASFPGCVPTISANGASNGIVWMLDQAGILRAYDAGNLARELYNSSQNSSRDSLGSTVKFSVPAVANGKLYAGTQTSLVIYGLVPSASAPLGGSNAASGAASAVVPGSILSIYGAGLAQSTAKAAGFPLPYSLAGASVTINGLTAPVLYASANQLNVQVPFEIAIGPAVVNVEVNGVSVGVFGIAIQPTAPGLFTLTQGQAAVLNQDSSVNGPSQPAAAGSVIAAWLTGLGAVDNAVSTGVAAPLTPLSRVTAPVTASVGGQPASVLFAGFAPGFAGLYQVNIMVPQLPSGAYPLQITAGGVNTNSASISIR